MSAKETFVSKSIEMVELNTGEVVAVGPFPDLNAGSDFAEHIEDYNNPLPISGSRGGVRLLSISQLAAELGVPASKLRAPKK
jgi:hypothetical protein